MRVSAALRATLPTAVGSAFGGRLPSVLLKPLGHLSGAGNPTTGPERSATAQTTCPSTPAPGPDSVVGPGRGLHFRRGREGGGVPVRGRRAEPGFSEYPAGGEGNSRSSSCPLSRTSCDGSGGGCDRFQGRGRRPAPLGGWAQGPRTAKRARSFRETLRHMADGIVKGRGVPTEDLAAINFILAENDGGGLRLERHAGGFRTRFVSRPTQPIALLGHVAESAAGLLASRDLRLIRRCGNPDCVLYFYDATRNHRRQWCAMATCGNLMKVRAFRRRHRRRAEGLAIHFGDRPAPARIAGSVPDNGRHIDQVARAGTAFRGSGRCGEAACCGRGPRRRERARAARSGNPPAPPRRHRTRPPAGARPIPTSRQGLLEAGVRRVEDRAARGLPRARNRSSTSASHASAFSQIVSGFTRCTTQPAASFSAPRSTAITAPMDNVSAGFEVEPIAFEQVARPAGSGDAHPLLSPSSPIRRSVSKL